MRFRLAVVALIACSACGSSAPCGLSRLHEYSTIESVTYAVKDGAPLEGDLYLPRVAPRAGVLMIHGGSWSGGRRGYMRALSERLAVHGYAVFNVSYRFAPSYRYPAQIEDARDALRWLSANGASFGLDRAKISVWGYSAGAYIAAMLGTDPLLPGEVKVCSTVAGAGPYNLEKYPDDPAVLRLLGTTIDANRALFHAASPVSRVTSRVSPFFLYYGTSDTTVDPSHSIEMKEALDRAGVMNELHPVTGLGHISLFLFGRSAETAGLGFLERAGCSAPN